MSHFTKVATKMIDKDLITKALDDLGWNYVDKKAKVRGYLGASTEADICISFPGANHDVGLVKSQDGYQVIADWWGMEKIMTEKKFVSQLGQKYAYHAVRQKLESQGFTVAVDEVQNNKAIHLVLRRMA